MSANEPRSHRKIRIGPKKKIAFVCSGGATKAGAFHLGVALALQEQGFKFYGGLPTPGQPILPPGPMEISAYVGSSAGSMIASFLAAGYSLDNIFNSFTGREPDNPRDAYPRRLERMTYPKMFRVRPELAREQLGEFFKLRKIVGGLLQGDFDSLFQLKWLKATGLFSTAGIEEYIREEVMPSNRFEDYPADLFIVATQLNHSRKVVFGKYAYQPPPHDLTCKYDNSVSISDAVASSTALPFVFAPWTISHPEGGPITYIDGEIRETLSTHVAVDSGADLVISSYTHQPYHYSRLTGSLTEYGLPAILIQTIYLIVEQKINNHIHNKQIQRNAIRAVDRYCREEGLTDSQRLRILGILEQELHHRMEVDSIYIHPEPNDSKAFFGEHFSLSANKLEEIVKSGFRAAINVLRRYEFEDREPRINPVGVTEEGSAAGLGGGSGSEGA